MWLRFIIYGLNVDGVELKADRHLTLGTRLAADLPRMVARLRKRLDSLEDAVARRPS